MKVKESMIGLVPYQPGRSMEEVKQELGLDQVVKLASNENPYGASPKAISAVSDAVQGIAVYPDGYAKKIREKTAEKLHVSEKQLLFGNGSDEVILILCRAMLNPGENIVTAHPTFPQYKHNAVIEGADTVEVPLKNGVHDLDAMLQAITEKTKIVFVCNPNNPSGTYVNEAAFLDFLNKVPEDVLVVSDEAYYEYVTAADYPDTIPLLKDHPNLLILRTFSKAYGLASLRVGFGVGSEALIQAVEPGREPFNTNSAAQAAAEAALDDTTFLQECTEKNAEEMRKFTDFLDRHGFSYYPSEANFLLLSVHRPGGEVFDRLLRAGYIVRNGEALGFPEHVRITLGTREQNQGIRNEIRRWLELDEPDE
ncbi:histidinol-phosphate transaminase [Alkalicoccus urumqiensis]|uniref:Histidinol-phosphate aminotransferase n=1 Tax=Alkalicoccus urumqiensis TaxID=1548213 RepID=A0A2P6MKJ8_ALKUR|nr:histidinol-phosphate transaminase [Alkalicoccus urumqiensis]PRO66820.1 histidinol-phosphate transaminase [Alkalicoccus urumqiensis]